MENKEEEEGEEWVGGEVPVLMEMGARSRSQLKPKPQLENQLKLLTFTI